MTDYFEDEPTACASCETYLPKRHIERRSICEGCRRLFCLACFPRQRAWPPRRADLCWDCREAAGRG